MIVVHGSVRLVPDPVVFEVLMEGAFDGFCSFCERVLAGKTQPIYMRIIGAVERFVEGFGVSWFFVRSAKFVQTEE